MNDFPWLWLLDPPNSILMIGICFTLLLFAASVTRAQELGSNSDFKPKLTPKLNWSGDLRYRMTKVKESIDDERPYQQLRARLGVQAELDDSVRMVFRLATGMSAINSNQNLGDAADPGMSRRGFGLDLAYVNWATSEGTAILAGKTISPFWAPASENLVFDPMISFEGMAFKVETPWSQSRAFLNVGGFIISENYDSSAKQDVVDTGIVGVQFGYSEQTRWGVPTVHASSYQFLNIQDKEITTIQKEAIPDTYSIPYDRYRGNIIYRQDPTLKLYNFQDKFVVRDLGLEWKMDFSPVSVVFFYDALENTEANEQNRANEVGLSLAWGRTLISWAQFEKQAESVVGAFTDYYINGGGTDTKGTRWQLTYQLSKSTEVSCTQIIAKRGVSTVERDYSNSMVDLSVVF